MSYLSFPSPVGHLTVFEENGLLVSLDWGKPGQADPSPAPVLLAAKQLLDAYFDGIPTTFDLPLTPADSPFQQKVREAMLRIPYGETRTYGALAREIGGAPRAVGGACGRNPLPIIVPCHRVIASDGSLGGYSGVEGITTKRFLLDLESRG